MSEYLGWKKSSPKNNVNTQPVSYRVSTVYDDDDENMWFLCKTERKFVCFASETPILNHTQNCIVSKQSSVLVVHLHAHTHTIHVHCTLYVGGIAEILIY